MLLLPPSEGKAQDGNPRRRGWSPDDGSFGGRLAALREQVVVALDGAHGGDERLLGVRGDHLVRAQSANRQLLGAPTLAAWERYTGVVWDHLDPSTLPADARRRIVVVSGLLGLARGDDPVPDYRLKMGANLPPLGKLSTWWRSAVTDEIARLGRRRLVIDLLPQEHRAALDVDLITGLRVDLVDPSGAPGGHAAKAAKGDLARAILSDGVGALDTWSDDRFHLELTRLDPGG